MKNALSILTAVILLAFSFTFSSCKNCNGNKGKGSGGDNPVTDRDKDKDQNKDNPANSITGGDENDNRVIGKDKGKDNGQNQDNRATDRGKNKGKDSSDNHAAYRDRDASVPDHIGNMPLTEVGKILYKRGCKINEIREMEKIAKENFGMDVKDEKYIGHMYTGTIITIIEVMIEDTHITTADCMQ